MSRSYTSSPPYASIGALWNCFTFLYALSFTAMCHSFYEKWKSERVMLGSPPHCSTMQVIFHNPPLYWVSTRPPLLSTIKPSSSASQAITPLEFLRLQGKSVITYEQTHIWPHAVRLFFFFCKIWQFRRLIYFAFEYFSFIKMHGSTFVEGKISAVSSNIISNVTTNL
jgi:hypothetical protein